MNIHTYMNIYIHTYNMYRYYLLQSPYRDVPNLYIVYYNIA